MTNEDAFKDVDILELTDRYNFLIKKYSTLAVDLANMLEKFGKYRKELQALTVEFVNRGIQVDKREDLEQLIHNELEKRKA